MRRALTSFLPGSGVHDFLDGLAVIVLLLLRALAPHLDEVVGVRLKIILIFLVAGEERSGVKRIGRCIDRTGLKEQEPITFPSQLITYPRAAFIL